MKTKEIKKTPEKTTAKIIEPDFNSEIAKSRQAIAEATELPKRPVGRPPKQKEEPEAPQVQAAGNPLPEMGLDISSFVKQPLKSISKIPAIKYQCAELELTEDEATDCAESLNKLFNVLVPDVGHMDPKTAAIIGTLTTFGSIGFTKYSILKSKRAELIEKHREEMARNNQNDVVTPQNPNPNGQENVPAGVFFARTSV